MDVLEIDAASNTGVDNVRDVIIGSVAIAPRVTATKSSSSTKCTCSPGRRSMRC